MNKADLKEFITIIKKNMIKKKQNIYNIYHKKRKTLTSRTFEKKIYKKNFTLRRNWTLYSSFEMSVEISLSSGQYSNNSSVKSEWSIASKIFL